MEEQKIEDIIPDIKQLVERGIHATMLSVVDTIHNQMRNEKMGHINKGQLYWDSVNLTFTLGYMADHFINNLNKSLQLQREVENEIGDIT